MSRTLFEQSLVELQENILALGDMVEEALVRSVDLLEQRDLEGAQQLIEGDRVIDEKRYAIEAEALVLIATQAPMAGDMRTLAAALFIANELERIGDYAKGIARVNVRIGPGPLIKPLIDIPRMVVVSQDMLHRSLEAYARRDVALARAIIPEDDVVDALYDQIYAELMTLVFEDMSKIRQANLLLMAAHNLERAADRATNICERVIYVVTGELLDTGWEDDTG
jgi:phosphate transport system protein